MASSFEAAFSLRGKRILTTGSASGIGRAFALLAAEAGASIAMLDLNSQGLEETAAQGSRIRGVPAQKIMLLRRVL